MLPTPSPFFALLETTNGTGIASYIDKRHDGVKDYNWGYHSDMESVHSHFSPI